MIYRSRPVTGYALVTYNSLSQLRPFPRPSHVRSLHTSCHTYQCWLSSLPVLTSLLLIA